LAFGAFAGNNLIHGLDRGFTSLYFLSNAVDSGWDVTGGNPEFPYNGWQFRQLTPSANWLMLNAWSLAWMQALRLNQLAQFGIWWIPTDGGLFGALVVCTQTVSNLAPWSGAYAFILQREDPVTVRLTINLLRFGATSGGSGPLAPSRTVLLDCGTIGNNGAQLDQAAFTRGGSLVRCQAVDRITHWELAWWIAQEYYPAGPGTPVDWEMRGTVNDSTLDRGTPGYIIGNSPATPDAIQLSDNWMGYEPNPWPLDWWTPAAFTPARIRRIWGRELVPHTFDRQGRLTNDSGVIIPPIPRTR
jgi:hypothetical protein